MARYLVSRSDVHQFIERCMKAVGAQSSHGSALAKVLVEGDYRGHYSHGLNRLDIYLKDLETGICAKDGEPLIEKSTVATALVNGNNLIGPVVGNFCMDLAIQKAKDVGVGWVSAYGSNHYGIAGFYSMQALKHSLIGITCTNTSPLVVPTRGKKIEVHQRHGKKIPVGWGCDSKGNGTTDPVEVLKGGGLLPLGGNEAAGGYKGYGLSLMVEVFGGILSGSLYSENIRPWKETNRVANLGQCFIAINPNCFASGFEERMSDLLKIHRSLEQSEPGLPVLVPGDPEVLHITECEHHGGIPYHVNVINFMNSVAKDLGVNLIPTNRTIDP
ncbi:uncharacterized oxidoreductase YjmC-like isoform X4 [Stegostoma tigrinum]|uniref:uncharacterized oxidoreductase YjmC-like isoform X4 n=1 Tax=Stegostoma tigrinum TaxID=3053191 RepID=UPI00287038A0|nr:uncharacterized oxidoreductase YjmC-like isoform X4 [Stegostoma tigrinum]